MAVVGMRGRGGGLARSFREQPDAEVTVLCDPDRGVLADVAAAAPQARAVADVREVIDDPDVDVVVIATPNHWHALIAVWALQAGKHVYVEKPLSHDLGEGQVLAETAQRVAQHGIVLQHGTQARSQPAHRDAIDWLRSGGLGEVRLARGLCYKRRKSIGLVEGDQEPPPGLDYDLWTGPAELLPLRREKLHYDWHWDFNTGNGDIGNQGVHQLDIARWGLGVDGFPARVRSCGGRVGYVDDGNTPNSLVSHFDYGERSMVFEVRGLETDDYKGARIGVVFHGERGYLVSTSTYEHVVAFDPDGQPMREFSGGRSHARTFLDAVAARDPGAVTADAREGHVSSGLGHLANISYMLGSETTLGAAREPFGDDVDGNESWARLVAHLDAQGVGDEASVRVGPELTFDPASERFTGEHAVRAQRLAARVPRWPYTWRTRT